MSKNKTHNKCRHFDDKECPHRYDETMKLATLDMPDYYSGVFANLSFPSDAQINEICIKCDSYTQK